MLWTVAEAENPVVKRLLRSVPADSGVTFSRAQLEVVKTAFETWQGPVDIRVTVPIWRRWYLVVLAGAGRRRPERIKEVRMNHPLWVIGNAAAVGIILVSLSVRALVFSEDLSYAMQEPQFFLMRLAGHVKIARGGV